MFAARYATAADIDGFFGSRPRQTVVARVIELDGKVVSVAGLAHEGTCLRLFWDVAEGYEDAMRSFAGRRVLAAERRVVIAMIARSPVPVVAYADNHELLESMGFAQIEGDDYLWLSSPNSPHTLPPAPTSSAGCPASHPRSQRADSSAAAPV